jgi:hypothetical protein
MLKVEAPEGYAAERRYILSIVLGDWMGLDWKLQRANRKDVRITLSGVSGAIRLPDILFRTPENMWLTAAALPQQPLPVWECGDSGLGLKLVEATIPIIYGDLNFPAQAQQIHSNQKYLPIDIFGSAFFMLTRYEEVVKPVRDEHERFPAHASLAYQENFLLRPIVDEYVEILWAAMKQLWGGLQRRKKEYHLVITHDVDKPFGVKGEPWNRIVRHFGGDLLLRRNPGMAARRMAALLLSGLAGDRLDPNNTFGWIMEQSERYGLRSEFYFMAGKTTEHDSGYNLFSSHLQRLLRYIHDRGHIIGLHPSYGTLGRPDLLSAEVENLRKAMDRAGAAQPVRNGRQHYLRWQAERSWADWEEAGLEEDSSVGFAKHVGFRAGTSKSFPVWSLLSSKSVKLIERPLIAMERSLLSKKKMRLDANQSTILMKRIALSVKAVGGNFVLLWHNDSLLRFADIQTYERILIESC